MKIRVSELDGAALDWAVAKCEGITVRWSAPHEQLLVVGKPYAPFVAHRDWGLCGEIIEREDISFRKYHRPDSEAHGKYYARICRESGTLVGWHKTTGHQQTGTTPLIAAMRCYVASKLGDEIDIPEEIV